jgi:hypothetical protein
MPQHMLHMCLGRACLSLVNYTGKKKLLLVKNLITTIHEEQVVAD